MTDRRTAPPAARVPSPGVRTPTGGTQLENTTQSIAYRSAPPTRQRYRYGLRPLADLHTTSFTADAMRLDRLELSVVLRYAATPAGWEAFLGEIGEAEPGLQVQPQNAGSPLERKFNVRHVALDQHETKIVEGGGRAWFTPGTGNAPGTGVIKLSLTINPTRALAHATEAAVQGLLAGVGGLSPAVDLLSPDARPLADRRRLAQQTLDRSDNVLMGRARNGGGTLTRQGQWWARVEDAVLEPLQAAILAELTPRPGAVGVELRAVDWTVTQAEAYCEFRTQDATSAVLAMAQRLRAAHSGRFRSECWTDGAAATLNLNKGGEITMVAYAKATDRVRLEVRYVPRASTSVRNLAARRVSGRSTWTNLRRVLDGVRADAARRLEHLKPSIVQPVAPLPLEPLALHRLSRALDRAATSETEAETAFTLLLNHGGISPGGLVSAGTLQRLDHAGVVTTARTRLRGQPRHVPTARYAAALDAARVGFPAALALAA